MNRAERMGINPQYREFVHSIISGEHAMICHVKQLEYSEQIILGYDHITSGRIKCMVWFTRI